MNTILIKKIILMCMFIFISPSASALLLYDFSTNLTLVSGNDASSLQGANITFSAEIADTAIYSPGYFNAPRVSASNSEWTISGSNVDGIYNAFNPTWHASYNGNRAAGWLSGGGFFNGIANLSLVSIFHVPVNPQVYAGDLVQTSDWGAFSTAQNYWRASDGSRYNWHSNATFKITEVPEPATIYLLAPSLLLLVGARLKRKYA